MQFIIKDGSTYYSLIGEAYVHGIINGELMNRQWASRNILSSVVVTDSRKNVVSLLPLSLNYAETFEAICEGIVLETHYTYFLMAHGRDIDPFGIFLGAAAQSNL